MSFLAQIPNFEISAVHNNELEEKLLQKSQFLEIRIHEVFFLFPSEDKKVTNWYFFSASQVNYNLI